jgi:hypothetical protein
MRFRTLAALLPLLFLAACGDPSKADILKKAEKADTRDKLEKALGRPQDISKLGPIETWVYKAKDGQVAFTIAGDTVAMQITQDKEKK